MTNLFFNDNLQNAAVRIATTPTHAQLLLDKNEQSNDMDTAIKEKVLRSLLEANWNRYPSADCSDIEVSVANYCGLAPEQIVLGPGSASFITTLLNYFALNQKRIVIAQPTYTLFHYHCNTYNIAYTPWHLTPELEYDIEQIPTLEAGDVLIVTTPNNPVGNTLKARQLEEILSKNPQAMVIVDAVYAEFAEEDLTPLVGKYENLMVLRSFSKAFPMAGLRLGYCCASPKVAGMVRKLMLQFSLNHLTQVFAREVLFSPEFLADSRQRVRAIIAERERVSRVLGQRFEANILKVYKSEGNFLLVRIFDTQAHQQLMADLEKSGIKVLNTSSFVLLGQTLRVSIGNRTENNVFIACVTESLRRSGFLKMPMATLIKGDFWVGTKNACVALNTPLPRLCQIHN